MKISSDGPTQAEDLPGHQPFSSCKRFLRSMNPPLWEESEHLEAEVRTIGSLFIACALNTPIALYALFRHRELIIFLWIILAFAATLLLKYAFRTARLREVKYTYLNFILAFSIAARENSNQHGVMPQKACRRMHKVIHYL